MWEHPVVHRRNEIRAQERGKNWAHGFQGHRCSRDDEDSIFGSGGGVGSWGAVVRAEGPEVHPRAAVALPSASQSLRAVSVPCHHP